MSVVMPNALLGVRGRAEAQENSHGERVRAGWGPLHPATLLDGRTTERADGGWSLGVDPACWPVRQGDLVVCDDGRSWIVNTAQLLTNNEIDWVDWVRVDAAQRTSLGTEPADPWMVGRHDDAVLDDPVEFGGSPVLDSPGHWSGHGPPPADSDQWQPAPGDEYLDLDTGIVYIANPPIAVE